MAQVDAPGTARVRGPLRRVRHDEGEGPPARPLHGALLRALGRACHRALLPVEPHALLHARAALGAVHGLALGQLGHRQVPVVHRQPRLLHRRHQPPVDDVRHRAGHADRAVCQRVHGVRPQGGLCALLLRGEPLRHQHAHPGDERQPGRPVPRVGRRGPLLVHADRLLRHAAGRRGRQQEGVRDEPDRRPGPGPRHLPHLDQLRHRAVRRPLPGHRRQRLRGRAGRLVEGGHPVPPAPRRLRQERAGPALHLAPGRHVGPDARQRAHPRGHHGHGRHLPAGPHGALLHRAGHRQRMGRARAPHRGLDRLLHRVHRRHHRLRAVRLQARLRLLHHQLAGLHGDGPRRGHRLRRRLLRVHPRVVQGPALPDRRRRDARHGRPGGLPQARRPPQGPRLPAHHDLHAARLPVARHRALQRGRGEQGHHPLPGAHERRPAGPLDGLDRHPHRRHHRLLRVPRLVPPRARPGEDRARPGPAWPRP